VSCLADGRFHSGEELGQQLGVSRSAIWKQLRQLEQYGLEIHSVPGKGHRLAEPIELLDAASIRAQLLDTSLQKLHCLDIIPETDSTNRHILKHKDVSTGKHAIVMAEHQTAGRGRRGRPWLSPFGCNLYFSLLNKLEHSYNKLEGYSLIIAIALARVLRSQIDAGIGIKWPNDLYWQGKKLGGILIELSGEAGAPVAVVTGVGLNVNMMGTQTEIDQPWTSLRSIFNGALISRNTLAAMLIHEINTCLDEFFTHGISPFLDEWRQFDLTYEQNITIKTGNEDISGIALGITPSGALQVKTSQGLQTFLSGDVSIRLQETQPDDNETANTLMDL
jgi:BirA family biotin operon repressor/biotin-[acetyl-CoA-carboxylase] ligase